MCSGRLPSSRSTCAQTGSAPSSIAVAGGQDVLAQLGRAQGLGHALLGQPQPFDVLLVGPQHLRRIQLLPGERQLDGEVPALDLPEPACSRLGVAEKKPRTQAVQQMCPVHP